MGGPLDLRYDGPLKGQDLGGNGADLACDHYHLYEQHARLMGEIGIKAHRLSIAWPCVMPEGRGAVNEEGLAFYDRSISAE